MTVKAIKPKRKGRQWGCQSFIEAKRCGNKALIEHRAKVGILSFAFPVKLKLCMPCSMKFSGIFPRPHDSKD